jgi:hypothetical protein
MQCLAHALGHDSVRTPETQEIKPQTVGMDENQYLGLSLVLHFMKMWMEVAQLQWCLLSIPPPAMVMMSMTRMWLKGSRCHHMSLLQARLQPTMHHVSLQEQSQQLLMSNTLLMRRPSQQRAVAASPLVWYCITMNQEQHSSPRVIKTAP